MRAGDVEAARRASSSALAIAAIEGNAGAYREPEGFLWQAEEFVRMEAAAVREGDFDSAGRALSGALAASDELHASDQFDYVEERVQALVRTGLAWTRAGDADIARTMFSRAVVTATDFGTGYGHVKALAGIAFALASGRWPAADDYPDPFPIHRRGPG